MLRHHGLMAAARLVGSCREHAKFRDIVVPFDQRRHRTEAPDRALVKPPYLLAHRMVVRIEQVVAMVAMAREMELRDPVDRNRIDINFGVKAMVEGADEDIVDIEQDSAVSFAGHRRKELPFGQSRMSIGKVARHVLHQYWPSENVLDLADARCHVEYSLVGVGQWQEVVEIVASHASPA